VIPLDPYVVIAILLAPGLLVALVIVSVLLVVVLHQADQVVDEHDLAVDAYDELHQVHLSAIRQHRADRRSLDTFRDFFAADVDALLPAQRQPGKDEL
jgi:uncharacterized MAPEG superfamily protein